MGGAVTVAFEPMAALDFSMANDVLTNLLNELRGKGLGPNRQG
jgi:hypothetical protein